MPCSTMASHDQLVVKLSQTKHLNFYRLIFIVQIKKEKNLIV